MPSHWETSLQSNAETFWETSLQSNAETFWETSLQSNAETFWETSLQSKPKHCKPRISPVWVSLRVEIQSEFYRRHLQYSVHYRITLERAMARLIQDYITLQHLHSANVRLYFFIILHYIDVIMTTMASQITSLTVAYSIVYSSADQRKHQSSASLAFVQEIHRDRWIPRTKGQENVSIWWRHHETVHLNIQSAAHTAVQMEQSAYVMTVLYDDGCRYAGTKHGSSHQQPPCWLDWD